MIEHDDYAGTGTEGPKPKFRWLCEVPSSPISPALLGLTVFFAVIFWMAAIRDGYRIPMIMPSLMSIFCVLFFFRFIRNNINGGYVYVFRTEDGMTWFHDREPFLHEGRWVAFNEKTKKTVALKKNSIVARIPVGGWRRSPCIFSTGVSGPLGAMWIPLRANLEAVTIVSAFRDSKGIFEMTLEWPAALAFIEEFSSAPGARLGKSGEKLFEAAKDVYAREVLVMVSQGYLEDREQLHGAEMLQRQSELAEFDRELKRAEMRQRLLRVAAETIITKISATKDGLGRSKHAQAVRVFCESVISADKELSGETSSYFQDIIPNPELERENHERLWDAVVARIQQGVSGPCPTIRVVA